MSKKYCIEISTSHPEKLAEIKIDGVPVPYVTFSSLDLENFVIKGRSADKSTEHSLTFWLSKSLDANNVPINFEKSGSGFYAELLSTQEIESLNNWLNRA